MELRNCAVRCDEHRHTAILLGVEGEKAFYVPMEESGLAVRETAADRFLKVYWLQLEADPARAANTYLQTHLGVSRLARRVLTELSEVKVVNLSQEEITMSTNDVKAATAAVEKELEKVKTPATGTAEEKKPAAKKAAAKTSKPAAKKPEASKDKPAANKGAKDKPAAKKEAASSGRTTYAGLKIKPLIKENPCREGSWSHFMLQAILEAPTTDEAQKKIDRNKTYGTASDAPRKADFRWAVAKGYAQIA